MVKETVLRLSADEVKALILNKCKTECMGWKGNESAAPYAAWVTARNTEDDCVFNLAHLKFEVVFAFTEESKPDE